MRVERLEDLPKLRAAIELSNAKPNFSQIGRQLGKDRRTVKKYYYGYQKPKTRKKASRADAYEEIIRDLLFGQEGEMRLVYYKRDLWKYLVTHHGLDLGEPAFIRYLNRHEEFKAYFKRD